MSVWDEMIEWVWTAEDKIGAYVFSDSFIVWIKELGKVS